MSPCASRRYLPVLRGFPAKFIYDPWNAPESVQAAAKCIIGVHYPKPMVHHAEASRLNIERMKQIYQQLSRYRGLGLLASVPSTNGNGNGNGGMMAYSPGEQQPGTNNNNNSHLPGVSGSSVATGNGSGSILLNFDSEEQSGPSGVRQQQQQMQPLPQQQQQHGYHSVPDANQTITSSRLYHEFAVPQHPGLLLHNRSSITGKRERESEREGSGEEDPAASCSAHKMQRLPRAGGDEAVWTHISHHPAGRERKYRRQPPVLKKKKNTQMQMQIWLHPPQTQCI